MTDESRTKIVQIKPIGYGLTGFRKSFTSACNALDIPLSDALQHISGEGTVVSRTHDSSLTPIVLQNLLLDLILAIQSLPASRSLPSKNDKGNLFGDLITLSSAVNAGSVDIEKIVPLLKAVLNNDDDELIWDNVYNAVTSALSSYTALTLAAEPKTPPRSGPPFTTSFQQTPWTFTTGSFVDTSDLRKDVDPILKGEVKDNLQLDHPDFFNTFFGQVSQLRDMATAVFQSCKDADSPLFTAGVGWLDWPEGCEESKVLQFLRRQIDQFVLFAEEQGFRPSKRRCCVTTPNKPIPGSVSRRKLDVGLAYTSNMEREDSHRNSFDWSHILIPGELKSNPLEDNYNSTWLDLVRYAREIFTAQDTRRFVLGFTLCGSVMRLWELDRLGVVGSTPFDVNKDGQLLVSVFLGYLWMSEEELGFDSTIQDDGERHILIQQCGRTERLCLDKLIKRQAAVVGRATTCWIGSLGHDRDSGVVIKDSWEFEERPEEGLLLKEATEAGVKNVAQYYHHETVRSGGEMDDVCLNVRKGLSADAGRNPFQQRRPMLPESVTSPTTSSGSPPGRGRSSSVSRTTRKRSSSYLQTSMPPPKRSCSDSRVNQDAQPQRNRVHRRLIMRNIGKSIYEASSLKAVLTGLLGGINGE